MASVVHFIEKRDEWMRRMGAVLALTAGFWLSNGMGGESNALGGFPALGNALREPGASAPSEEWLDVTRAVVVVNPNADPVEKQACRMLVEEAAKRSGITFEVSTKRPNNKRPVILLGSLERRPPGVSRGADVSGPRTLDGKLLREGYRLHVETANGAPRVIALGNDRQGCMFAAGRLLRVMRYAQGRVPGPRQRFEKNGRVEVPVMNLATAPAKPLRGHQIGWRPKSNTYDRWGVKEFEQYIRDLIVWGTNAIELIPGDPDTDPDEHLRMTAKFADVIASYGLQVWLWYPIDDRVPAGARGDGLEPGKPPCPSTPDGRRYILDRRRKLFRALKHLDAVFIPGGDPAGCAGPECQPWVKTLLPLAEDIARLMRESHPHAQMWLSNQGFVEANNRYFYNYLRDKRPQWLNGIVYGPWAEETIESMRRQAPPEYPVRQYPDITHVVRCQFPARDWDNAFALTLDREPPIYRPTEHAHIARMYQGVSCGAITYSDGVNDDLNKVLWSALLWNPEEDLRAILVNYGRYYMGEPYGERVAAGLLGLERNWRAPLQDNEDVKKTYNIWTGLEREAPDNLRKNWRFQMALLRACYDRYIQWKLDIDTNLEKSIYQALLAEQANPSAVLASALKMLTAPPGDAPAPFRAMLFALGQMLYDNIGMQLSVSRWGASGDERGAILDHLDVPLSNLEWIKAELQKLQKLSDPAAIRAGIERIVKWEDPGPGGFYDDLGNPTKQPHLVRLRTWEEDPGYVESVRCDFRRAIPGGRQSWNNYAEALYGTPIILRYTNLDPKAAYKVRVTYSGRYRPTLTLTANDKYLIHGPVQTSDPPIQREWPIPREATAGGSLTLKWEPVTGRGAQVSEVWLIRQAVQGAH